MRRRNEPCELNPIFVLHILKWIKRSVSGMEPKEWKHDVERAISKVKDNQDYYDYDSLWREEYDERAKYYD